MLKLLPGIFICVVNLIMGISRLANYEHCTNCVTKGMSNLRSDMKQHMFGIFSIMLTIAYTLLSVLCKWSMIGVVIACIGLIIPFIFKMIQARNKSYIKNQRRFTRGGLRVAAASSQAVGTGVGAYFGGVFGAKIGNKVGQGLGSGFDAAANNMTDVDMDFDASGIRQAGDDIMSMLPQLPQDEAGKAAIFKDYLGKVGYTQESLANVPYPKLLEAVAQSGANDSTHPLVADLQTKGMTMEQAALIMAQKGGVV